MYIENHRRRKRSAETTPENANRSYAVYSGNNELLNKFVPWNSNSISKWSSGGSNAQAKEKVRAPKYTISHTAAADKEQKYQRVFGTSQ